MWVLRHDMAIMWAKDRKLQSSMSIVTVNLFSCVYVCTHVFNLCGEHAIASRLFAFCVPVSFDNLI